MKNRKTIIACGIAATLTGVIAFAETFSSPLIGGVLAIVTGGWGALAAFLAVHGGGK